MSKYPLSDLVSVTEARYQIEQAKLADIAAEEQKLRRMLAELTEQERSGRSTLVKDTAIAAYGGDVMWQRWVGRSRTVLNARLANVLARKDNILVGMRKAFGKKIVAEELLQQQQVGARAEKIKKTEQQIEDLLRH